MQASIAANTFVVSGPSQTKPASEYQPSAADLQQLMAQMGAAGVDMAQLQKMMAGVREPGGGLKAGGEGGRAAEKKSESARLTLPPPLLPPPPLWNRAPRPSSPQNLIHL